MIGGRMAPRWVGGLVALVACGNAAAPPVAEPVRRDVADAAVPEDAGTDAGSLKRIPFVEAWPEILHAPMPSGDYEIATQVVSDTCNAGDAGAPENLTMFVQMKATPDKDGRRLERLVGNFPLPLPRNGRFGVARSDIQIDPPAGEPSAAQHGYGSLCPDYETKTTYRVIQVIGKQIDLRYVRDYGDASKCPAKAKLPSKCSIEVHYTFKLVNKVCDAICNVQFAKGDGGVTPKCDCPARSGQ
jgi:hypothetical protein